MKKILIILLTLTIAPLAMAKYQNIKVSWQNRNISYQAQYKLDNDSTLQDNQDSVNLSVASFNHVVLLVGQVPF